MFCFWKSKKLCLTGFGLFCTAYTIIYSCGPFLSGLFSITLGLSGAIRLSALGAATAMLLILLMGTARFNVD